MQTNTLVVWARTADGTTTGTYRSTFWYHNGGEPTVTSAQYPEWEPGGGAGTYDTTPGDAGRGVVRGEGERRAHHHRHRHPGRHRHIHLHTAGAGCHELYVRSTTANGTVSDERYYVFDVAG